MSNHFLPFIFLLLSSGCQNPPGWRLVDVKGEVPAWDFTLNDMKGGIRHGSDDRGKVTLLFTGFTHCPDILPGEPGPSFH